MVQEPFKSFFFFYLLWVISNHSDWSQIVKLLWYSINTNANLFIMSLYFVQVGYHHLTIALLSSTFWHVSKKVLFTLLLLQPCAQLEAVSVRLYQFMVIFSPETARLAAGCKLTLVFLLARANPENASEEHGSLLEIGSGWKQVTYTSETNAVHCLLQLNIHGCQSLDIDTSADRKETAAGIVVGLTTKEGGHVKRN